MVGQGAIKKYMIQIIPKKKHDAIYDSPDFFQRGDTE